ncbi:hypothetical protein SAMN05414139_09828 [Burkholderia sp. D7]|nr:hypothetical protein SAMN05414139_09828 [Burkholderia sp. D7]
MLSISPTNHATSSAAIPEPVSDGDKPVKYPKAEPTKPSGAHPAMQGLMSMKTKPGSGTTKCHALRAKEDIGALPQAADSLNALAPRAPSRPSISGMPPELIDHIGKMADPIGVIALGLTNLKHHAVLQGRMKSAVVDVAIQNIQNPYQYNDARTRIAAMDPSLRADRLDALVRKSNHSGRDPVNTFFDLSGTLKGASPDSRGNAIRTLSDRIRTLEARNVPLARDQERAHDTLLAMTKEMSLELQRDVLRSLTRSPAPETSRAKAQQALDELG